MREPIDPEILREALPPEVHEVVNQVSANVNRSVKEFITQFKTEAAKILEDFKSGNYPAELEKELNAIEASYAKDMDAANAQLADVRKAAKDLAAAASKVPDIGPALRGLEEASDALQKRLNDIETKLKTFGEKSGGAVATAAYKFFTGGVA